MSLHRGENPYKCSQCEKAFSNNTHLKSYEDAHWGETLSMWSM